MFKVFLLYNNTVLEFIYCGITRAIKYVKSFNKDDLAKEFGLIKFLNGKDPSGKSRLNKLKFKRFFKIQSTTPSSF